LRKKVTTKQDDDHTYTLTVTVRNQPGVLVRCAQVFNRRGHNIEALQVEPAITQKNISSMSITAYGKPAVMDQIVAQLAKLVDVIHVEEVEL
jgi:acetolactate synthase I/III small subunit